MTYKVYQACDVFLANHDYNLHNSYIYNWESDIFALSKGGLAVEIEVKVSRSDYLADFKKEDKHRCLKSKGYVIKSKKEYVSNWGYENDKYTRLDGDACRVDFIDSNLNTPNRFYYACPEGLILDSEVPKYAGLIYVTESGGYIVIKKAPLLHRCKNITPQDLLSKFYWRRSNAVNECYYNDIDTIESLKEKIDKIKKILK